MRKKDPTDNDSQLGNLLERYKKILKPPQASMVKEAVIVIKEVTGIELRDAQVAYNVSSQTLSINAPSLIRSELRTYHPKIITALRNRLGATHAPKTIL